MNELNVTKRETILGLLRLAGASVRSSARTRPHETVGK